MVVLWQVLCPVWFRKKIVLIHTCISSHSHLTAVSTFRISLTLSSVIIATLSNSGYQHCSAFWGCSVTVILKLASMLRSWACLLGPICKPRPGERWLINTFISCLSLEVWQATIRVEWISVPQNQEISVCRREWKTRVWSKQWDFDTKQEHA